MAILFASLSLLCAGVNDVLFKSYRSRGGTLGPFFAVAGALLIVIFLARGALRGSLHIDGWTLLLGSLAGFLSAAANFLLVWAMKETGAGLSATIYRLNLVLVAFLAFIFLGEQFGAVKIIALAVAVAAVVLFSMGDSRGGPISPRLIGALLAASALRAGMGVTYKWAALTGVNEDGFLALSGFWWLLFGVAALLAGRRAVTPRGASLLFPVVSGLLIGGIILFMKLAVNLGDAGVVVTITQFSFLITFPIAAVVFREKITRNKIAGLALAVASIGLLGWS